MIKGSLKRSIQVSRGLRQVDALSPFLFLIVMDVLSQLILMDVEGNMIEPFRLGLMRSPCLIFSLQLIQCCFVLAMRIPSWFFVGHAQLYN